MTFFFLMTEPVQSLSSKYFRAVLIDVNYVCLCACFLFRLERLQRIVSKVQMESGVCEEQLNQVETLLQTVRFKAF